MKRLAQWPEKVGRAALLCTLATVVACGGGGGSTPQDPAPAPPAESLSVAASATQTQAGGNAVEFTATLQNRTTPVVWSLTGPGTLSATSGTSVRYTPPAGNDWLVTADVSVTASSVELVRSLTIQLRPAPGAPAPVPGTRWEVARAPKHQFTDLRLLNGRFFATNSIGGIVNSTDGINWTPRTTPVGHLHAINQGSGGYMAVGRNTVFKSVDGDVWVDAGATGEFEFIDVASGNGVFVAISNGGLSTSADGAVWTRVGPPGIGIGFAVAFGSGRFVAVGNTTSVYHSTDGTNWTTQPLPITSSLKGVAYGNGRFLVIGEGGNFVSTDGLNWTPLAAGLAQGYRLRFANGRFFQTGARAVWVSADGMDWRAVYWEPTTYHVIGMAESGGRYAVANAAGEIFHHNLDSPVSDAMPGPEAWLTGVLAVGAEFFAVSDHGDILRSTDARVWTEVSNRLPAQFRGISHGNGVFVAVSNGGPLSIYRSTDGRQWTGIVTDPPYVGLAATAYGNGTFVATAGNGTVFHSTDALRWTQVVTPVTVELTGVAFGNGRFVAGSVQGHLVSSTDGVQWTLVDNTRTRFRGVTHGAIGFVAVGQHVSGGAGAVWNSADGLNWFESPTATPDALNAVTFGNGKYLVSGDRGTLLLSNDGLTWQQHTAGIHPALLGVAAAGGRFVAVGWGGAIVMSEQ